MAQHFVICTDSQGDENYAVSAKERDRITRFLRSRGWPVWHWFEDCWLTVNKGARIEIGELRAEIDAKIAGERAMLILEVDLISYSGRADSKAWSWMKVNWNE